jgi:hypothetical protein
MVVPMGIAAVLHRWHSILIVMHLTLSHRPFIDWFEPFIEKLSRAPLYGLYTPRRACMKDREA